MSAPSAPRVSIAIPVYNGARTLRACIDSALAQTYERTEIVVVDNASTDATVTIVNNYDDPRIRLTRNPRNIGFQRNHNLAFALSRGEFIKPLHADDRLLPRCVERMLELFDEHEQLGLVFAPRQVELGDPTASDHLEWLEVYGRPERNFSGLERVNDGRFLLRQYLKAGLAENWVGEPSCLMLRRSTLERVGMINPHIGTLSDVDQAIRVMAVADVGFIDEELSVMLRADGGLTDEVHRGSWLDRLWMLEALMSDPEMSARVPEAASALSAERRRVARQLLRTARREPAVLPTRLRQVARCTAYAARRIAGREPVANPSLEPFRG